MRADTVWIETQLVRAASADTEAKGTSRPVGIPAGRGLSSVDPVPMWTSRRTSTTMSDEMPGRRSSSAARPSGSTQSSASTTRK